MPFKKNEQVSANVIPATSPDVRKEMLEKIREVYPALFGEGNSLNTKELQALVDDYSKPEAERYSFPWAGKTESKRFAFNPSKARLVPDKERSVDFDTTKNLIIEGENLEVLKLLQASYFKKVKMIYIDPPYNTGHDFVYPDDYSESKQAYWEKNGVYHDGVRMDTNTESSGRYHSNWLSMMQSRLLLARNLLRDDGVIFVSIDDHEVHNLRRLMDEIFGEENFIACLARRTKVGGGSASRWFAIEHDYVIAYARSSADAEDFYAPYEEDYLKRFKEKDEQGSYYWDTFERTYTGTTPYKIKAPDNTLLEGSWFKSEQSFQADLAKGDIRFVKKPDGTWSVQIKTRPAQGRKVRSLLVDNAFKSSQDDLEKLNLDKSFDFPKPLSLIRELVASATDSDDIILDFFAGSGSLGQAVIELNKEDHGNRRFILVQLPEATDEKSEAFKSGYKTISQITIERVKRAGAAMQERYDGDISVYNGILALGIGKEKEMEIPFLPDTGFKVLRLTKSLFPQNQFEVDPEMTEEERAKAWEAYLEKSKQAHLFDFDPEELLAEILLKDGFDLNFKVEILTGFKKNKVMKVSDGEKTALVCLDENVHEDTVKDLEPHKERRFICLERAVDTTRKWNLKRMFGEYLWVA